MGDPGFGWGWVDGFLRVLLPKFGAFWAQNCTEVLDLGFASLERSIEAEIRTKALGS